MQILTWNTQWCCGLDGIVSPRRIIEHARNMADFDVLCLQEIASNWPMLQGEAGIDQAAQIAALLPGFQVFFGAALQTWDAAGQPQHFGNLIATRLPALQVQHHALPYPPDPAVESMPRMCTCVTVDAPGLGPLRVLTTHLEYYSRSQRSAQAAALRQLLAEYAGHAARPPQPGEAGSPFQARAQARHTLLCGDFNLEASDADHALIQQRCDGLDEGWHDVWQHLHPGQPHAPTFRLFDRRYGPLPVACDFFFASGSLLPHLTALRVDGQTQVSDHQPVLLELAP
ncbi:endonuclease [Corticibacter populi]|uniref:Endonuclease n=1 Tax=Corticibacter populi TaxID=1550736 RepID=A0A3M6QTL1_9BURK|nr:endonuclease/exonuclease/phosphatase family protein [Corticibacter populi]RMX06347.1 endonuclease [Corticibacter populi]RZS32111.1 endonuclease/exonuclease/phosphatase family metal-dependent hydrolase [Corticibacter populi]